jgi:hypothetical protein
MKTKAILLTGVIISLLISFSFKSTGNDEKSKTILISIIDAGFRITYSDGTIEKLPFKTRIKVLDNSTWVEAQAQATQIINEMRERGFRFKGTATLFGGMQAMVLERD